MYIVSRKNCQNCNILKSMLGGKIITTNIINAEENIDLCRKLNIKTVPALVRDDETVVYELDEIVTEVERDYLLSK